MNSFFFNIFSQSPVSSFQLCQAIRLMLKYTGTEYEEKFYPVGDAPAYDKSEWLSVKFKLGLAFPNVS